MKEGGDLAKFAEVFVDQTKPGGWIVKGIYAALDASLASVAPGATSVIKGIGKGAKALEPILQGIVDRAAADVRDNLT